MRTDIICRDLRCDHGLNERPRYYARQLITADDLTLEQDYFRNRLRLHNRLLHGWGIVCGAVVEKAPKPGNATQHEPWKVVIKPGYLLGPYGDEIVIDCERTFDLRAESLIGVMGEPCIEEIDPWCSEVPESQDSGDLFVAVRYREVKTRPVRVQPTGCSCDDTSCEYSRLRDGYEIKALRACPDSHTEPEDEPGACPPCPEEPWVVLAKVVVAANGDISNIGDDCRRTIQPIARALREHRESLIIKPEDAGMVEEAGREHKLIVPPAAPEPRAAKKSEGGKKKGK
jgi:hypothetical protein